MINFLRIIRLVGLFTYLYKIRCIIIYYFICALVYNINCARTNIVHNKFNDISSSIFEIDNTEMVIIKSFANFS